MRPTRTPTRLALVADRRPGRRAGHPAGIRRFRLARLYPAVRPVAAAAAVAGKRAGDGV